MNRWLYKRSLRRQLAEMQEAQVQSRAEANKRWSELMEKMQELLDLVAKVEAGQDSALEFINGLKQQLFDAKAAVSAGAPATTQIQNIIDGLTAHSEALAAAIVADPSA